MSLSFKSKWFDIPDQYSPDSLFWYPMENEDGQGYAWGWGSEGPGFAMPYVVSNPEINDRYRNDPEANLDYGGDFLPIYFKTMRDGFGLVGQNPDNYAWKKFFPNVDYIQAVLSRDPRVAQYWNGIFSVLPSLEPALDKNLSRFNSGFGGVWELFTSFVLPSIALYIGVSGAGSLVGNSLSNVIPETISPGIDYVPETITSGIDYVPDELFSPDVFEIPQVEFSPQPLPDIIEYVPEPYQVPQLETTPQSLPDIPDYAPQSLPDIPEYTPEPYQVPQLETTPELMPDIPDYTPEPYKVPPLETASSAGESASKIIKDIATKAGSAAASTALKVITGSGANAGNLTTRRNPVTGNIEIVEDRPVSEVLIPALLIGLVLLGGN